MDFKNVIFLRHGRIEFSHSNDYDLSYQDFMRLLLKESDPPLARARNGIELNNTPKDIDVIYHSSARRSIETAKFIQQHLEIQNYKFPRVASNLNRELAEVKFSKNIISNEEFEKGNGLRGCRPSILRKWFDGDNEETFDQSIQRVEKLCKFLKSSEDKTILLITHGFYLRLLYMYFKREKKNFRNLEESIIFNYGQYFSIRLTDSFLPDPSFFIN